MHQRTTAKGKNNEQNVEKSAHSILIYANRWLFSGKLHTIRSPSPSWKVDLEECIRITWPDGLSRKATERSEDLVTYREQVMIGQFTRRVPSIHLPRRCWWTPCSYSSKDDRGRLGIRSWTFFLTWRSRSRQSDLPSPSIFDENISVMRSKWTELHQHRLSEMHCYLAAFWESLWGGHQLETWNTQPRSRRWILRALVSAPHKDHLSVVEISQRFSNEIQTYAVHSEVSRYARKQRAFSTNNLL